MSEWLTRVINESEAKGLEEGLERGREDERLSSIRNIMESLNLPIEKAMDALRIPKEEQGKYILMMEKGEAVCLPVPVFSRGK